MYLLLFSCCFRATKTRHTSRSKASPKYQNKIQIENRLKRREVRCLKFIKQCLSCLVLAYFFLSQARPFLHARQGVSSETALRALSLLSGRYRCPFRLEAIANRRSGDGGVAATFLESRGRGRRARALSIPSAFSLARASRGGRPIKYVDRGGVWRLRMRAAATRARARKGERGSGQSGGEKEGTGRRAERGDERLAYGLCGARYRRDRLETGVYRAIERGGFSETRAWQESGISRLAPRPDVGKGDGTT